MTLQGETDFKKIQLNFCGFENNNCNNIDKETVDLVLQKLRDEVTEKVRRDLDDLFDAFVSDVGQISQSSTVQNGSLQLSSAINR